MIKTFIFVEDGSVDTEKLTNSLGDDVKVITYRQGCVMPKVLQPEEPVKTFQDTQDVLIYEPTKKALNKVLKCKMSKKVRKILEELFNDYYSV